MNEAIERPQRNWMPWEVGLLMAIGLIDLVATAVLHQKGLIVELNPLMKPLIERSEWLFAAAKGMTLVVCWSVMVWYSHTHLDFIRKAAKIGAFAYLLIWCTWFFSAM